MPPTVTAARELVRKLRRRLTHFRVTALLRIRDLGHRGDSIVEATKRIGESWSGSWAGYHARLYYKAFQRPVLADMFDVEWGGRRGLPAGWEERSPEEVKAAVEKGSKQSIGAIEQSLKTWRGSLESFRTEVAIAIASLSDVAALAKDVVLLSRIDTVEFGTLRAKYVASCHPRQMASRDSHAIYQGLVLPAHIFYEAVGVEASSMAQAAEDFARLVDRFIKQAESRLSEAPLKPKRGNTSPRHARKVFLVHGHDVGTKERVARFLEKLELTVIVLHEQADGGKTIIEKFESFADVGFAVVLLTPDDVGSSVNESGKLQPRARQNVVLELGYFLGALGRKNVAALRTGDVELPSDLLGVLYIDLQQADWHMKLARELKNAGIAIDLNKAIS